MNIQEIKDNLANLAGEEREQAILLLNHLGINIKEDVSQRPKHVRTTTKLDEYHEHLTIECSICLSTRERLLHYQTRTINGGYALVAVQVPELPEDHRKRKLHIHHCQQCFNKIHDLPIETLRHITIHALSKGKLDAEDLAQFVR